MERKVLFYFIAMLILGVVILPFTLPLLAKDSVKKCQKCYRGADGKLVCEIVPCPDSNPPK